jgi:Uncharacterized protein conserved in bacteria (DUF2188)
MSSKSQHVIPHNGKWAVKAEGSKRITSVYETKKDAIDAARNIARRQSRNLYIHGRSGQILLGSEAPSKLRDNRIREAVREVSVQSSRSAAKKPMKKSPANTRRKAS